MSTYFYRLAAPITNIEVVGAGAHVLVKLWVNHALAGGLTVWPDEAGLLIRSFAEEVMAVSRHGIAGGGVTLKQGSARKLADNDLLISGEGELIRWRDLRGQQAVKDQSSPATDARPFQPGDRVQIVASGQMGRVTVIGSNGVVNVAYGDRLPPHVGGFWPAALRLADKAEDRS